MYAWETFNIYRQQDARWFEPLNRRQPTPEHLAEYRAAIGGGWRLRRRGLWFIADPPGDAALPAQGWKLHVSTRSQDSTAALRAALPVLREAMVPFKFLMDPWSVRFTNGKLWPRGSSGKFMAVYPPDEETFRAVATALATALREFTGPYVLSDRRCPDSTTAYYRYGGFTGNPQVRDDGAFNLMIKAPDGSLYPDERPPYWNAPPWLDRDPFGLPAVDPEPDPAASDEAADHLLDGRFRVETALHFSNRGGVYRAHDTRTGRAVIIKEARPHVGLGSGDIECVELLGKEHRLLTRLADTGHFVAPVSLFAEWEHHFLAEELVEGPQLSQISISENPLYTLELTPAGLAAYHGRMLGMFGQLTEAIAAAHRAGIVLGDLSWTNVLVEEATGRIRVIDLEGAIEEGVDPQLGLFTKGISSPDMVASGTCRQRDDWYALGSMMFGAIMLANNLVGYHPPALARVLDEVCRDLGVPADLPELVRELTGRAAAPAEWDPAVLAKRIAALSVTEPAAWPQLIPLARPAAEQLAGERLAGLRDRVRTTVEGTVGYLHATATPERTDRLFPADLGVFETNPLGLAFGACGVLHTLRTVTGEVPDRFLAWVLGQDADPAHLPPGLYHGLAGIAWVLAESGQAAYAGRLLRAANADPLALARAGVLHGAAGLGLANLRLWQLTGDDDLLAAAVRVGRHLADTAEYDDRGAYWRRSADPLTGGADGGIPLGYGHGPAGVALFQLYLTKASGDDAHLELGRRALDYELAHAQALNPVVTSFPSYADRSEPVLRSYWDQGTAGVVTTLVRYLAATGDPALRDWLPRLLPDICRKYAVSAQLFHGLAGLGNAVLDVAEFTGDEALLAEAWRVAEGVLQFAIDTPEGIAFPGEQAVRESADLATGGAGVALFLHRLAQAGPGRRTNANFLLDDLLAAPAAGAGR